MTFCRRVGILLFCLHLSIIQSERQVNWRFLKVRISLILSSSGELLLVYDSSLFYEPSCSLRSPTLWGLCLDKQSKGKVLFLYFQGWSSELQPNMEVTLCSVGVTL